MRPGDQEDALSMLRKAATKMRDAMWSAESAVNHLDGAHEFAEEEGLSLAAVRALVEGADDLARTAESVLEGISELERLWYRERIP